MKKFTTPVRCHQLTLFYKSLCAFGLFLVCCVNLQAQHIDSLLSIAETNFPQEKVYIQTDKSIYAGGETIWFKAYLTADNQPGPFCKTLYAELITDKGYVLQRRTMPIVLSGASSDFIVPDSLNDSKLFIRAYTQWMLNFDSTLLCVKPVYVIPRKAPGKKNVAAVTTLTFFPEGGDLIEEIESTVAFKAVNQDGIPVAVSGDILNSQNKKIAAFSAVHDGMGTFLLQPMAGEKYKAVWKDKSGKPHETALPPAKKTGVAIHISYVANKLYYTLQRPQAADESYTKFTVMAQSQQRMMYAAAINMSQKTTVTAPIETDSIPDGVVQITVFNALSQPVAERLVFVNNNNYSFITDLHMAEQNMNKRARSVLQIDVGGKTLSNLSVSVTDADVNPAGKNEENIYSGLLLSSDLKGYVYNPAYYFSEADSAKSHLDLVMLTNGWRRLKWENIIAGQWPVIKYQPDNYLGIEGKVLGLSRTMLYNRSITAFLTTKSGKPQYYTIPMNEKGEFNVSGLYFFDTAKLHYQLSNDKDKTVTTTASFYFGNSFMKAPLLNAQQISSFYMPDKTDSATLLKNINTAALSRSEQSSLGKTQVLEEVKIITKKKSLAEKLDDEYTSGFFSGNGDGYTFALDEDPSAQSSPGILEYLQGKVPGLQISTAGGQSATWRGSATSFFMNESPTDVSQLQSINMRDVALIKVFRPPFMGATGGGSGGAIAIYTKKGGATNDNFTALPSTNIYGYSAIREFYSPDYSVANNGPTTKDYRTTLYWNPHVYFDKNSRRITLPFFNNDNCKKIRVIVEGINEFGTLTREEKVF